MEKTEIIEEIKKYNHTVLNNEVIIQTIKEMKLLDRLEVLLVITDTIPFYSKTDGEISQVESILRKHFIYEFISLSMSNTSLYNPKSYEVYTNENKKIIKKAAKYYHKKDLFQID